MVYKRKNDYEYINGWKGVVDANTVGEVVEQIEERDGEITPAAFLEASRPTNAPTHGIFTWDDQKAAEKYRLQQARNTILSLRVVSATTEDESVPHRAFLNVSTASAASYISAVDALRVNETRVIVLDRAKRELQSFKDKYAELKELAQVFKAIEQL